LYPSIILETNSHDIGLSRIGDLNRYFGIIRPSDLTPEPIVDDFMKKYNAVFSLLLLLNLHAATPKNLVQQCQNKSGQACHDLGYLYDQKGKVKKAAKFYKRACDLRHAMGCYHLAELYLVGSGVVQSDASFITYTQKACTLGYKKSCSFGKKAQPASKITKQNKSTPKKKFNKSVIKDRTFGSITVHAKLINKQKRIVQIDASMINRFSQASGWLSFSFPGIGQDILLKSRSDGFDRIRSYPKASNIFSITHKKPIRSGYLLIEGEAKYWAKNQTKKATITLKIPPQVSQLTLYVRGSLKHKNRIKSIPQKGTVGQQGFHNHKLIIPIGTAPQNTSMIRSSTLSIGTIPKAPSLPQVILSRKDKLLLLDQLLDLSYYHRERKAFEKQLKETLFGGAKYLTYIKSYRCTPRRGSNKSRCSLKLVGQTSKGKRIIRWEFHAAFTARKEAGELKITEMHSLDLLE